jgi:hypothetical protein
MSVKTGLAIVEAIHPSLDALSHLSARRRQKVRSLGIEPARAPLCALLTETRLDALQQNSSRGVCSLTACCLSPQKDCHDRAKHFAVGFLARDPQVRTRFQREALAPSSLNHPNVKGPHGTSD